MLVSYLGFVQVKLQVIRVLAVIRKLYSLPGDLIFELPICVLEFHNTSYDIKIPFILYPGLPGSHLVI